VALATAASVSASAVDARSTRIPVAGSIENVPTDARVYDDLDLLKTSGLIRSMPSTSRPWTRGECRRLTEEALATARLDEPSLPQRAALKRLRFEFAMEPGDGDARRPTVSIPVPDIPNASGRCDFFSRATATRGQQRFSLGAVLDNRPGRDFAFYERFELTGWQPGILEDTIRWDSSGKHIPGTRVLVWRNLATLETELAYAAFRIPWLRLEMGRDEFVWGPGYSGSVMLDDTAPSLDHIQFCADYRSFRFLTFTSLLSRWGLKPRFFSAQRIEASFWNRLTLGGALLGISSWNELHPWQLGGFINPLIPIYLTEANTGHGGNFLVGLDAVCYLPRTKVYAQFFLDNYEFNSLKNVPNSVAFQAGAFCAPNLPVDARLEYTRVNPFTYYHWEKSLMYENYLTPMGHPLGSDADQWLVVASTTPAEWLKVTLSADYTRRGYYNRGDYWRRSFKNPGDTTFLRHHFEFPARGWDSAGAVIEEVDRTVRVGPGFEVRPLRDLFLSGSLSFWMSENYQGVIGLKKNGLDFAIKLEYRY
jgi:hypothetical protein